MSKTRASNYGRRKNNPFSTSTFKLEGLSQFDWSHTIAYDSDFGDLRPIACFDNIIGQRTRCNLAYVLNMDPLRKPLYSGINVTYDAVYVSDQLLGYDSQKWFNPVTTDEERIAAKQPFGNAAALLYTYYCLGLSVDEGNVAALRNIPPRPIYNTLYDAFGYPFSSIFYDNLDRFVVGLHSVSTNIGNVELSSLLDPMSEFYVSRMTSGDNKAAIVPVDPTYGCCADLAFDEIIAYNGAEYVSLSVPSILTEDSVHPIKVASSYGNIGYNQGLSVPTLVYQDSLRSSSGSLSGFMSFYRGFVCVSAVPVPPDGDFFSSGRILYNSNVSLGSWLTTGIDAYLNPGVSTADAKLSDLNWDGLCRDFGWSSYQECLDAYRSYLYSVLCFSVADFDVDLRPIFAYRRAYNDLYVNTNLWDCDEFSDDVIDLYYGIDSGYFIGASSSIPLLYADGTSFRKVRKYGFWDLSFLKRWWPNDMFTSAVPADMSAAANAVEIPSSGVTLVDLRNLNVMQEVQERENYAGQRVTDTTFAFFGFKSPELNYYYARHIARITDSPTIQNVLQNSETAETPQANPAGYGTGAKSARFFDFQNPWYGFILILSSVMTEPVYKDAVPRMILKKDYEDFLFPPYQEISDISVDKSEVQAGESGVLGFQRSYYYYMRQNHRLSGTMRLRQKEEWNTARDFRDGFALNVDFATPNSSDRLNRIFADQSDGINHFNFFVGLDVQTILPLKRDIHYHL